MKERIGVVLFEAFETLDVFGPVEILGRFKEAYTLQFVSLEGGLIRSSQGVNVMTERWKDVAPFDILLMPGGAGTRRLVDDKEMLGALKVGAEAARWVLTVCTGSAVLARTGLLDGRRATSNKRAFEWVTAQRSAVCWVRKARWVKDEKFYTSSGVSAGIDMALAFIGDRRGKEEAIRTAQEIEYVWQQEEKTDLF